MERRRKRSFGYFNLLFCVLCLPAASSSSSIETTHCAFVQSCQPASTLVSIWKRKSHPSTSSSSSLPPRPSCMLLKASSSPEGRSGVSFLNFIRNDALSLTIGSFCLLALITNRLFTDPLYDSQSRTDILGVFSAGSLLLNGLTLQDIAVREAEEVNVGGQSVDAVDTSGALNQRQTVVLRWAADTFLQALPNAVSVIIWRDNRTLLCKGLMGGKGGNDGLRTVQISAIAQKALTLPIESNGLCQPTYIPDLQVIPGRVEFGYLPELCQSVVLQPFDQNRGLVILGGNMKRNLTPRDLARARVIAQKIQSTLG